MVPTQGQKDDLRDKVAKLVKDQFGGDYHKAFDHYDSDVKDGKISRGELTKLLSDADIGNWLTRPVWATAIIAELDTDQDGSISAAEFEMVLQE